MGWGALLFTACSRPSLPPPPLWQACLAAPVPAAEDALEQAEAALDRGAMSAPMDALGCRVLRRLPDDGGVRRLELEAVLKGEGGPRLAVLYVRELGAGLTRDLFDREGDGVFELELDERRDDGGRWLESRRVDLSDAGPARRWSEERLSATLTRTVREHQADGGWVTDSDETGPMKPQVLPIQR